MKHLNNKGSALLMTIIITLLLSIMAVSLLVMARTYYTNITHQAQESAEQTELKTEGSRYISFINLSKQVQAIPEEIIQFFYGQFFNDDVSLIKLAQTDYDLTDMRDYKNVLVMDVYNSVYRQYGNNNTAMSEYAHLYSDKFRYIYMSPYQYTATNTAALFDALNARTVITPSFIASNIGNVKNETDNVLVMGSINFEYYNPHGGIDVYECHMVFSRHNIILDVAELSAAQLETDGKELHLYVLVNSKHIEA